jgi:hypothetical protein
VAEASSNGNGLPLLLRKQKNSKQQGDIGLGTAIAWFVQNGYRVSIPLTDSQDYDLVVEVNGNFYGVQVRTTYYKRPNGVFAVNLRVSGGNRSGTGRIKHFDPDSVAYLFVVTEFGDKYFIPSNAIVARNSLTLCDKYEQYRVT